MSERYSAVVEEYLALTNRQRRGFDLLTSIDDGKLVARSSRARARAQRRRRANLRARHSRRINRRRRS